MSAQSRHSAFPSVVSRELWSLSPNIASVALERRQLFERLKALLALDHVTLTASVQHGQTVESEVLLYSTWPEALLQRLVLERSFERDAIIAAARSGRDILRPSDIRARAGEDPVMIERLAAFAKAGVDLPTMFPVFRHKRVIGTLMVSRAKSLDEGEDAFLAAVAPGFHRLLAHAPDNETRGRRMLTPKELECLRWASLGKTSEDTARLMGISPTTVETHFKNAATKLAVHNRVHTVAEAIRQGWIS